MKVPGWMVEAREPISCMPALVKESPRPCQIIRGRGVMKSSEVVVAGRAVVVDASPRARVRRVGSWSILSGFRW